MNNLDISPIFIVGCDHSGTSLLISILSVHSKLYAVKGESYMFFETIKNYKEDCSEKFSKWAMEQEGKERWIEKTPVHADYIKDILTYYPKGKVIGIIRDGRDVVASLKIRTSLKNAVKSWLKRNRNILSFRSNERVSYIKYEDLVTKTEETLRKVLDFIGEEWEDELLEYYKTPKYWYHDKIEKIEYGKTTHHQYRNWQINQPIFDGNGKWREKLNAGERNKLYNDAGDLLKMLGYIEDDKWVTE